MNKKLLVTSFAFIVVLLVFAGAAELLMAVSSASVGQAGSAVGDSMDNSESSESSRVEEARFTAEETQAALLVKEGDIVANGKPLKRGMAEEVAFAAEPYVRNVEHVDQMSILPSGCEIVSLAVALKAEGYDADPVEIADKHLRVGGDFSTDYVGTPRDWGGGLPPCIVDAGNSWLRSQKGDARVVDLTGTTFEGVAALVDLGYPVLVWTTEDMVDPCFSGIERNGLRWYDFEHCVVVCGVEGGDVVVADPIDGMKRRDRLKFERIYKECGRMAAFVLPRCI